MVLENILCTISCWIPGGIQGDSISALCYHGVSPDENGSSDRFEISRLALAQQLRTILDSGRKIIGLKEPYSRDRPAVMLTFDDNLPSHVAHALPVLSEFGVTAVFYLNPGEIGRPGAISHRDVEVLLSAGMWIGAHNTVHTLAAAYTARAFAKEVAECKRFLLGLGMPLTWAYPGGHPGSFYKAHEEVLLDHGFSLRFSTLEGPCRFDDPDRAQGRYVIRRNCSPRYFRTALDGGLQLVRYCKQFRFVVGRILPMRA